MHAPSQMASRRPQGEPASVLVVRPGAMGDVLLTTPALRALRTSFPGSRLEMLVTRPGREILAGNTDVDETILLDKSSWRPQVEIIGTVRGKHFELVIDFLCNPRTAVITRLSGAPNRLGYGIGLRRLAYNIIKPRDEFADGKKVVKYAAEVNLDMVRYIGVSASDTTLRFTPTGEAFKVADEFIRLNGLEGKDIVAFSPSGSWPAKTWQVEKFARLADLMASTGNVKTLILWGPGEKGLAQRMSSLMKTTSHVAPNTSVAEVGALIGRSALLVSNDSGLKHIAVALGTPTVTVYGPTNPKTWNPALPIHRAVSAQVGCLSCDRNECDDMRCMNELSPEDVFSVAREMLVSLGQS